MATFERRLSRATARKQPGYLRVKAANLLEQGEPAAVSVAIELLKRVVTDYDDFLEVPRSHELLGRAYRRSGDLQRAQIHLQAAIDTADERRNGLGLPELELAEVMIDAGNHDDAAAQLRAVEQLQRGMIWSAQFYRHAVARARVEHQTGGDPVPWAERALELAADTEPQLARHPTVGLVDASADELNEMTRLAKSKAKRRWRRG